MHVASLEHMGYFGTSISLDLAVLHFQNDSFFKWSSTNYEGDDATTTPADATNLIYSVDTAN